MGSDVCCLGSRPCWVPSASNERKTCGHCIFLRERGYRFVTLAEAEQDPILTYFRRAAWSYRGTYKDLSDSSVRGTWLFHLELFGASCKQAMATRGKSTYLEIAESQYDTLP